LYEFGDLSIGFLDLIINEENVFELLQHFEVEASLRESLVIDVILNPSFFSSHKVVNFSFSRISELISEILLDITDYRNFYQRFKQSLIITLKRIDKIDWIL
jgi:hypothetical protein